jgi:fructan beta-fructosidase
LKQNAAEGYPLELLVEFDAGSTGKQGLTLFQGAREDVLLGVDRDRGWVSADRTRSGNGTFHNKFPGVYAAPLAVTRDGRVKLHVFLDACSLEVFVNDGERVLTTLVFPSKAGRGIELFGPDAGARVAALDVWPLRSSWK